MGVTRRHDVVEAEQIGERADELVGRGGGEHERAAGGLVFGDDWSGVRSHDGVEFLRRRLAGAAHGLQRPSLRRQSSRTSQPDRRKRFADEIEDAVDGLLRGEGALVHEPRLYQRLGDQRAAGPAEQCAIKIEKRCSLGHRMQT